jgi:hypothetical protein
LDHVRVPGAGPAGPGHAVPRLIRHRAVGDGATLHGGQQPAGRHINRCCTHPPTGITPMVLPYHYRYLLITDILLNTGIV